jgi:hypothetical protein
MPAAFSHLLLLDEVTPILPANARACIEENPVHAALGCLGPDILFFYANDWGAEPATRAWRFYADLYKALRQVIDAYEHLAAFADPILDQGTAHVWSESKAVVDGALSLIRVLVEDDLVLSTDFFEYGTPPLHKDYSNIRNWHWIDLGHHRSSNDLFAALWNNSGANDAFRAYALGYLTHIAGDVVGHAQINYLVGGPYRNHWRRHVFLEKILDVQTWQLHTGTLLGSSSAYTRFAFDADPDRPFPGLPDDLAQHLSHMFSQVYGPFNLHSGVPSSDDFSLMYGTFYEWLRFASTSELADPGPCPGPISELPEALQELFHGLAPERLVPPNLSVPHTVDEAKTKMRGSIVRLQMLVGIMAAFAATPALLITALTIGAVKVVLWVLRRLLFEAYVVGTYLLAIAGYIHPLDRHLRMGLDTFVDVNNAASFVSHGDMYVTYPQSRPDDRNDHPWAEALDRQVYHLFHPRRLRPDAGVEPTPTHPFVTYRNQRTFRDQLLDDNTSFPVTNFLVTPPDATTVYNLVSGVTECGSAKQLTRSIVEMIYASDSPTVFPNWNLDSDRGFDWPAWEIAPGSPPWPLNERQFSFHPPDHA